MPGLETSLNPDWDLNRGFKLESLTLCLDSLKFRFFMPPRRRNSARDKVIGEKRICSDRTLVRASRGQARKLLPSRIQWAQFYHPRGVGVGKACLFLSGNSSSSLVSGKVCIQIWQKGGPEILAFCLNLNAGLIPSPT